MTFEDWEELKRTDIKARFQKDGVLEIK